MSANVLLLGFPVRLGALQREHLDGVLRELQLIALAAPPQRDAVPTRLLALVDLLRGTYAAELAEPDRLRDEAVTLGLPTVDLTYPVRPETRQVLAAWTEVLEEVDAFARADDLLVLARPDEVVALDQWVTGEFLRQLDGQEPTAWPGPL